MNESDLTYTLPARPMASGWWVRLLDEGRKMHHVLRKFDLVTACGREVPAQIRGHRRQCILENRCYYCRKAMGRTL